jgi:hypothetical protein
VDATMLRSTTPDAAPGTAPGTQPWDSYSLAAAATPAFPATALKGKGWRPGVTPGVTPGGLSGHFTALVTPGGASWPEGMPAGGLVPYSITPPAGGRTVARTAPHTAGGTMSRTPAHAAAAGTAARTPSGDVSFCASTPAAEAAAAQQGFVAELPAAFEGAAGAPGALAARRSLTPPAATPSSGRFGQGFEPAGSAEPCWGVTPVEQGAGSRHQVEPGSARRSRTPSRTPQSAVKNEALAAQLQVGVCSPDPVQSTCLFVAIYTL